MTYIEVEKHDGTTEIVPESYLNIGAYQLMHTENDKYNIMLKGVKGPQPSGFCIYPEVTY